MTEDHKSPSPQEPNLRYEWDGIAGKMRYFGSSAPNGWIGEGSKPYEPNRAELVELLSLFDRQGVADKVGYQRAVQDLRSAICYPASEGQFE